MIYLDNNATTQIVPEVLEVMATALSEFWGNPSSTHQEGQKARQELTAARRSVAKVIGCRPTEIIFTSGGSEALNLLINGIVKKAKKHIITSTVEHAAVRQPLAKLESLGWEIECLEAGEHGMVTADAVAAAIKPETGLIILMAANNETGVLLDLHSIAELADHHRIPFIVDGVALPGKKSLRPPKGVTAMAFSGHKFHGPKGVGFFFLKKGIPFMSSILGGPQEGGRRAGTENLPAILGMAKALEIACDQLEIASEKMERQRNHFEAMLKDRCGAVVNGKGPRICNTSNLWFSGVDGESLLMQLDLKGVAASHGSACSSGALEPSQVLLGMGFSQDRAMQSLRFSLSRLTTDTELEQAIAVIQSLLHANPVSFF